MLNSESLARLIAAYKDDAEVIEMIADAFKAFEAYHTAVLENETFSLLWSGTLEADEYRTRRMETDRRRTTLHNSVIAHVRILNRMAEQAGLPAPYEGVVSEERPYRRQVAQAVFDCLAEIVAHRS